MNYNTKTKLKLASYIDCTALIIITFILSFILFTIKVDRIWLGLVFSCIFSFGMSIIYIRITNKNLNKTGKSIRKAAEDIWLCDSGLLMGQFGTLAITAQRLWLSGNIKYELVGDSYGKITDEMLFIIRLPYTESVNAKTILEKWDMANKIGMKKVIIATTAFFDKEALRLQSLLKTPEIVLMDIEKLSMLFNPENEKIIPPDKIKGYIRMAKKSFKPVRRKGFIQKLLFLRYGLVAILLFAMSTITPFATWYRIAAIVCLGLAIGLGIVKFKSKPKAKVL